MKATIDTFRTRTVILLLAALGFGVAGCERQGPLEEAGEAIDDGIEDAREELEDAAEEVREAAEEAAEEAEEAAEDAADALRDR
jgi:F0F1-type ATP synthase membrane subunit b/b'